MSTACGVGSHAHALELSSAMPDVCNSDERALKRVSTSTRRSQRIADFKSSIDSSEITLESVPSVSEVGAADWDACANPSITPLHNCGPDALASSGFADTSKVAYNPFVSHAFFSALEQSGSACARTGWGPRHLLARVRWGNRRNRTVLSQIALTG